MKSLYQSPIQKRYTSGKFGINFERGRFMLLTARHSKFITRKLKKFGFVCVVEKKHHKIYRYITEKGEPTRIRTYISHGSKDYGDALFSKISEQLKLNKQELLDLLDGKMTRKEYEEILRTKGFITKITNSKS